MNKISIIIPIYNTKNELKKCLDSICNQTYKDLEIICVDDGSTDGSEKILDDYSKQDCRIKLIHKENGGESSARNVGLKMATGQYIGFMDCDDWIETDMYQLLMEYMEQYNVDIVAASWFKEEKDKSIRVSNNGSVNEGILNQEQLLYYVYARDEYQGFAYMWDKLYRREVLLDSKGEIILFDEKLKLGGDVLYLAQILVNVKSAVYMEKAFYHYRQRENSGCHMIDLNRRMDWLLSYQMVIELFEEKKISQNIMELVKRFLVYHSGNAALIAHQQREKEKLEECKNIMRQYEKEYEQTNLDHPERMEWYRKIVNDMEEI